MTVEDAGRSRRRVLVGLAAAVAVTGCGKRVMSEEAVAVEVFVVPGVFGATPDLRRIALTYWGRDSSAIGVCDLQAGSVEVLHAGPKVGIGMPALSPDGETMAFITQAWDPKLAGLDLLYLAPTRGGDARRIGTRAHYAAPSFSPDGGRILVFAGDKGVLGSVQLVEIDVASGAERVVWSGAFEGGRKAAYDPAGAGYWVGGMGPAASLEEATGWATLDYDTKHGSPRIFRILREDEPARPFAVNLGGRWSLDGVANDHVVLGALALETGRRVALVNRQGEVRLLWRSPRGGDLPNGIAVSADAKRVLTVRIQMDDAGNFLDRYEIGVFETGSGESGKVLSQVLSSDLRATNHDVKLA
jgi:dipeptidyl aminopeptidase/acylaminoacyl peptidase